MYIDEFKYHHPNWSDEEIIEYIKIQIQKGKIVEATDDEVKAVDNNEWRRVGTWTICSDCGKPFAEHPYLDYALWLHRLCNGVLGKT